MSEKRRARNSVDFTKMQKINKELHSLIKAEKVEEMQKASIFLQMLSYKKQCMHLKKKIFEMVSEMQFEEHSDKKECLCQKNRLEDKNLDALECKNANMHYMEKDKTLSKEQENSLDECFDASKDSILSGNGNQESLLEENVQDAALQGTKNGLKRLMKKLSEELVEKNGIVADLEKKLEMYKYANGSKVSVEMKETGQHLKGEVQKILSKNTLSEKIREENLELRKKIELLSYEAEKGRVGLEEENKQLENRNKFLVNKLRYLERERAEWNRELMDDRERYKSIIYAQRSDHMRVTESIRIQLKQKKEDLKLFKTESIKMRDEVNFLLQKLDRTVSKYEALKKRLDTLAKDYTKPEKITDQNLFSELENLSRSYDKLLNEHKDLVSRSDYIQEELYEVKKKNHELKANYEKLKSNKPSSPVESSKTANESHFDLRLFDYEKMREEYEARKRASAYHKSNYIEASNENEALRQRVTELQKALEEDKKVIEGLGGKVSEIKLDLDMALEDHQNMLRIIDCISDGKSSTLLENADKYKKLLKCVACDKRYKDTVINKCMHVFCQECIEQRIKSRNRMCPSCGEGFSPNDIKRIYL